MMSRIVLTAKVGSDGILHIDVPVGRERADQEVQVSVEPMRPVRFPLDEWQAWVQSMAGTWQGDFERPQQQPPEEREPL